MASPPYFPDVEMVMTTWIESFDFGFTVSSYDLPLDYTEWSEDGHILVAGVTGGTISRDTGIQRAIVQIESWAYNPADPHPQWWLASHNIEQITRQGISHSISQQPVPGMPPLYYGVRLLECNAIGPARRRNGDLGGYAAYVAEFEVVWIPLTVQFTPEPPPTPEPFLGVENLVFEFTDSMVWHIVHNLGYPPVISLQDVDGNEFEAEIETNNSDTEFYVRLNFPASGRVIVATKAI